jgi:glycosyltransferase involved in cell wall biosynthesis
VRFTIVSAVLNGMPWLPEAMTSVERQREGRVGAGGPGGGGRFGLGGRGGRGSRGGRGGAGLDVEHIVLDGGSTDGSREWLQQYRELGCRLILEKDDGQTAALRSGFDLATGELLGWLNSDDVLEPGALAEVHDVFAADPDVVMVSGACLFIDADGKVIGAMATPPRSTYEDLVRTRLNPPQPSTFFRADAYRKVGGLDTSLDLAMDVDLWLKLAKVGKYVVLPDRVLARYRVHAAAKSERLAVASAREDLKVRRRNGMRWRSQAGEELLRKGYLDPTAGRVTGALRRGVRAIFRLVVLGPKRALRRSR